MEWEWPEWMPLFFSSSGSSSSSHFLRYLMSTFSSKSPTRSWSDWLNWLKAYRSSAFLSPFMLLMSSSMNMSKASSSSASVAYMMVSLYSFTYILSRSSFSWVPFQFNTLCKDLTFWIMCWYSWRLSLVYICSCLIFYNLCSATKNSFWSTLLSCCSAGISFCIMASSSSYKSPISARCLFFRCSLVITCWDISLNSSELLFCSLLWIYCWSSLMSYCWILRSSSFEITSLMPSKLPFRFLKILLAITWFWEF